MKVRATLEVNLQVDHLSDFLKDIVKISRSFDPLAKSSVSFNMSRQDEEKVRSGTR